MKYVLLVEDDLCNQAVIQDIFEFDLPAGELVCVESGEDALEQVAQTKPCLVLMDIGLPGIDGLETTKWLKSSSLTKDITVWALTAHAMKGDEAKALAAGCDQYITKPIETKNLSRCLSDFLENIQPTEENPCLNC
jgi:CheY-like chemotaxis protein